MKRRKAFKIDQGAEKNEEEEYKVDGRNGGNTVKGEDKIEEKEEKEEEKMEEEKMEEEEEDKEEEEEKGGEGKGG